VERSTSDATFPPEGEGSRVSFAHPPVVEVVAGLAFVDYPPEHAVALSAFWREELRQEFPRLQFQPPYTPQEEQFEGAAGPSISFQLSSAFPSPRLWASTEDGQELVQLQTDWLALNWRKVKPDGAYDRWAARRTSLSRIYALLQEFLARESLANPVIRQCEVTYINHISLDGVPDGHAAYSSFFKGQEALTTAGDVEQLTLQASYRLGDPASPTGRLHLKVAPALNASGKPIYVLELTARSAPLHMSISSALSFLDSGRDAINEAFVKLTTDAAHRRWGYEG